LVRGTPGRTPRSRRCGLAGVSTPGAVLAPIGLVAALSHVGDDGRRSSRIEDLLEPAIKVPVLEAPRSMGALRSAAVPTAYAHLFLAVFLQCPLQHRVHEIDGYLVSDVEGAII